MPNNFELNIPVTHGLPNDTNGPAQGCLATYNRPYLAFDDTTTETWQSLPVQIPAAYTGSGTLKLDVAFICATATSGNFGANAYVEAITSGDAVDLDAGDSYDAANAGSTSVPATAGYVKTLTITLTNKDSLAAGDMVRIKFARDPAVSGDCTGDVRVLYFVLREEA